MSAIFEVIAKVFVDIWCSLRGTQLELDESSVVGPSEFEKEGPGWLWVAIVGGGLLILAPCFILLR